MFDSEQIWKAIDFLARRNGVSVSRLAIMAGLDPTAFNKSKRTRLDGRPRWLSLETLAKILAATATSPQEFFGCATGLNVRARNGAKASILLVEADDEVGGRAAAELASAGYDIRMVQDLRHALEVIESGVAIDLLITDIELRHGGHGRTLARIALMYRPRQKIIFLADTLADQLSGSGRETILRKPLKPGRLKEAAAHLLAFSGWATDRQADAPSRVRGNGTLGHSEPC
jgi:CheY-like chemotaxis protein